MWKVATGTWEGGWAGRAERGAIAKVLLQVEGIDVNKANAPGYTLLHQASFHGHVEVVKALLDMEGIASNKATKTTRHTPLIIACENGHEEVVKALLDMKGFNRPNVNNATTSGATPLYLACQNGHVEVVKALLDMEGIDVNKADSWPGCTPLHIASDCGHVEVVKALLNKNGIDANKLPAPQYGTPLSQAAAGGHVHVVEALLGVPNITFTYVRGLTYCYRYCPPQPCCICCIGCCDLCYTSMCTWIRTCTCCTYVLSDPFSAWFQGKPKALGLLLRASSGGTPLQATEPPREEFMTRC